MQKVFTLVAGLLFTILTLDMVKAHEFAVGLIIPVDKPAGRQYLEGFLLAAAERDSHPGEVSDGHLGGLDVYVFKFDSSRINATQIRQNLKNSIEGNEIAILAYSQPDNLSDELKQHISQFPLALLSPGITPFSDTSNPGTKAFREQYEKRFGTPPTAFAAQGYNAARRIDVAIRPLDSVSDKKLLVESFAKTGDNFNW